MQLQSDTVNTAHVFEYKSFVHANWAHEMQLYFSPNEKRTKKTNQKSLQIKPFAIYIWSIIP